MTPLTVLCGEDARPRAFRLALSCMCMGECAETGQEAGGVRQACWMNGLAHRRNKQVRRVTLIADVTSHAARYCHDDS